MKELTSRVYRQATLDEDLAEVILECREDGVVTSRTKCKSAYDGSGLRCWGMRRLGDDTCSDDGLPVYLFTQLEIGYAICIKHCATWRETQDHWGRDPYTVRSWSPPDFFQLSRS